MEKENVKNLLIRGEAFKYASSILDNMYNDLEMVTFGWVRDENGNRVQDENGAYKKTHLSYDELTDYNKREYDAKKVVIEAFEKAIARL